MEKCLKFREHIKWEQAVSDCIREKSLLLFILPENAENPLEFKGNALFEIALRNSCLKKVW